MNVASDMLDIGPPSVGSMQPPLLASSLSTMLLQTDGNGQQGHGLMDSRLINAVQRQAQAAFIEGDPKEDEDLELFYYHFVSRSHTSAGMC